MAAPMTSFLAVIPYPDIGPELFRIGPFALRWYALAYVAGLLLGWRYVLGLLRIAERDRAGSAPMTARDADDFLLWATLGVILGGRLGYVLFYQPGYYADHPIEALALWRGGMSFHGGLVGVVVAILWFARRRGIALLPLADVIACATPIGLFFGRIANFINGELYGRETELPWAMIFPRGGPVPRHPSQLYEAALEGVLLFGVMWALYRYTPLRARPGALTGLFLIGYGGARIFVELFREPDAFLGYFAGFATMGQILSLPMILGGFYMALRRETKPGT